MTEHPALEQLSAFGLGQLDETTSSLILQHLDECAACRTVVGALPDDTLASLVRSAVAPAAGLTCAAAPGPAPAVPATLADHPRYRVLELLGAGGMGAVYRAEHRLMQRQVALKVINLQLTRNAGAVERFRREAQAAARLAHPNIVTAHDADQAGDTHFLIMEYVAGTSLVRLVERQGPLPVALACGYVRQAALGLQHAHERGMVHRDVKPHNLMLAADGQIKILDFGLARFASENGGEGGLTDTGLVMGTPDYIAPEQAEDAHAADGRADIYSLGCTLYFLLTGQPPFPEGNAMQKLLAHVKRSPRPLPSFRGDVPPGVARILDRMIAKDPNDRYQTPAEVAAALAPFSAGPAEAVPVMPGPVVVCAPRRREPEATIAFAGGLVDQERPAPAAGKRRPRALLAVALACLLAGVAVAGVVFYIVTDRGTIEIKTDDPDVKVVIEQKGKYVTILDPKSKQTYKLNTGDYTVRLEGNPDNLAIELPHRFSLKRGDKHVVTVRRVQGPKRADAEPVVGEVRGFTGHEGWGIRDVAFTPNGRHALASDAAGNVILWDLADGKEIRRLTGHQGEVCGLAISADGRRAATCGVDDTVRLWSLGTGKELRRFEGCQGTVEGMAISPDGRRLAASSGDGIIHLWDVDNPKELRRLEGHTGPVRRVRFSPDGKQILSGGRDQTARLWDAETGKETRRLEGHTDWLVDVAFSSDGKRIASVGKDQIGRVWDANTGKELCRLEGHEDTVEGVAFLPDGRRVITGGGKTLRLWDARTGKELHRFQVSKAGIGAVAVSPDGRFALSGGGDLVLHLWRLPDPRPLDRKPEGAAVRPELKLVRRIEWPGNHLFHTAFSPDGRLYLAGGDTNTLRVWEVRTGQQLCEIPKWLGLFTPDGKQVVGCNSDDTAVYVYDSTTGNELRSWDVGVAVSTLALSADGKRVAIGHKDNVIRVWDFASGKLVQKLEGHMEPPVVALSPDGKRVFSGSVDKTFRLWDVESGKPLRTFEDFKEAAPKPGHGMMVHALFLNEGKEIAAHVWGTQSLLIVWDAASGKKVRQLDLGEDHAKDIAISPDGRWLLTPQGERMVRLWDLTTGKEVQSVEVNDTQVARSPRFSADGRHAMAGSWRSWVYLWRLEGLDAPEAGGAHR